MPRVGRHPLKKLRLDLGRPRVRLSVSTLVHVPDVSGFWENSLEVLRVSLGSLLETVPREDREIIVFDNASCPEVRRYLHEQLDGGQIDLLIHSRNNVGKLDALNQIFALAGGAFIAYTDSDVLLLPGWVEASLAVLDAFPEAAKVTALPLAGGDATQLSADAFQAASKDPSSTIEVGELIPEDYIEAHRKSVGLSESAYSQRLVGRKDVRIHRKAGSAFLSGADFQFTIRAHVAQALLPLEIDPKTDTVDAIYTPVIERKLVERGDWILCTTEYLVHHMGNGIPDLRDELPWYTGDVGSGSPRTSKRGSTARIASPRIRRVLKWIHVRTYELLYGRAT